MNDRELLGARMQLMPPSFELIFMARLPQYWGLPLNCKRHKRLTQEAKYELDAATCNEQNSPLDQTLRRRLTGWDLQSARQWMPCG
jgi:hypothetical protein